MCGHHIQQKVALFGYDKNNISLYLGRIQTRGPVKHNTKKKGKGVIAPSLLMNESGDYVPPCDTNDSAAEGRYIAAVVKAVVPDKNSINDGTDTPVTNEHGDTSGRL